MNKKLTKTRQIKTLGKKIVCFIMYLQTKCLPEGHMF